MPSKKIHPGPQPVANPVFNPLVPPRLLRITDAAQYLSCTYTWVETLIRERTIPSVIQGKRRLIDIRDLDAYIDQLKSEAA
jgi:excisionase family DNA binding protein